VDGFININKSPGMTSFDVIKKLKRIIPRTKLGHLGTLDPMAQGVLPVAIGFATRLIEYVSQTDKIYQASMTLGGVSDTQDAWGNIVYKPDIAFAAEDLAAIIKKYTGKISQIPPMYSAVHYHGERLYDLARQGIIVDREARNIEIEYIKLLGIERDDEDRPLIKMEVQCSKGTYIRTLCHDIGNELGTGAYMSALTRIRAGVFTIEDAYTLDELTQCSENIVGLIKPADFPLMHLRRLAVEEQALDKILNGNRIQLEENLPSGLVRVYDPQGKLIAMAECLTENNGTILQPVKVLGKT
jgi:tRNA pseudouridine55 synthase